MSVLRWWISVVVYSLFMVAFIVVCVCVCFVLVIYYAVLYVFSGLAIISRETRDMVILVLLSA